MRRWRGAPRPAARLVRPPLPLRPGSFRDQSRGVGVEGEAEAVGREGGSVLAVSSPASAVSIMRVPKPRRSGLRTSGPPLSVQLRRNRSAPPSAGFRGGEAPADRDLAFRRGERAVLGRVSAELVQRHGERQRRPGGDADRRAFEAEAAGPVQAEGG